MKWSVREDRVLTELAPIATHTRISEVLCFLGFDRTPNAVGLRRHAKYGRVTVTRTDILDHNYSAIERAHGAFR